MRVKYLYIIIVIVLMGLTACAGGNKSAQNCGCPQRSGMVGY